MDLHALEPTSAITWSMFSSKYYSILDAVYAELHTKVRRVERRFGLHGAPLTL